MSFNFDPKMKLYAGSNPLFGGLKSTISVFGKTDNVWVEGEGMLHVLHFTKDTDRIWSFYYKNRYVETDTYKMESKRKKPAFIPVAEGDAPATLAGSFFNAVRFPKFIKSVQCSTMHLLKCTNHNYCIYHTT